LGIGENTKMNAVENLGGGVVVANPLTSNWWVEVDGVHVDSPLSRVFLIDSGTCTVYNGVSTGSVVVVERSAQKAIERGASHILSSINLGLFALVVVLLGIKAAVRASSGRVD